jgi:hypothetical protein
MCYRDNNAINVCELELPKNAISKFLHENPHLKITALDSETTPSA